MSCYNSVFGFMFFDLKVNLTTLRKVKKLEERISVLEEGRESNDNN